MPSKKKQNASDTVQGEDKNIFPPASDEEKMLRILDLVDEELSEDDLQFCIYVQLGVFFWWNIFIRRHMNRLKEGKAIDPLLILAPMEEFMLRQLRRNSKTLADFIEKHFPLS